MERWKVGAALVAMLAAACVGAITIDKVRAASYPYTRQPITVCYQTDGTHITTAYVDNGAEPYVAYPMPETSASVEIVDGHLVTHHSARLPIMPYQTFLPVVSQ